VVKTKAAGKAVKMKEISPLPALDDDEDEEEFTGGEAEGGGEVKEYACFVVVSMC
jgi:hypothetical protein